MVCRGAAVLLIWVFAYADTGKVRGRVVGVELWRKLRGVRLVEGKIGFGSVIIRFCCRRAVERVGWGLRVLRVH